MNRLLMSNAVVRRILLKSIGEEYEHETMLPEMIASKVTDAYKS